MIVVDASVWVSILLDIDFFHHQGHSWFMEYRRHNGEMIVPSLLLPEVAAGLARRTHDVIVGRAAIDYILNLDGLHIVALNHRLAISAAELAANHLLREADAVYAALAYELDVPLLTWDQEQISRVQTVVKAGTPGTIFGSNGHGDSQSSAPQSSN